MCWLQALGEEAGESIEWWVLTIDGQPVGNTACLRPGLVSLWGISGVARRELPSLRVSRIDVASTEHTAESLADVFEREWRLASDETEVAWRGGQRLVPVLNTFDPRERAVGDMPVRNGGVYVVTGGQAGVGWELARELADLASGLVLVLIQRTPLPAEKDWDHWLAERGADDAVSRRIAGVRELRAAGAIVWSVAVDVADAEQMRSLWAEIHRRHGTVNGVVHAAGVLRDRTLAFMDRATLEEVFRPKVAGAWLLHELTQHESLDFFVLCASVSSLTCGVAQANHVAANQFEDALAHYRHAVCGLPALAIDWGYWSETGVVATDTHRQTLTEAGVGTIRSAEGRAAFRWALRLPLPQVGIAPLDWKLLGFRLGGKAPETDWSAVVGAGDATAHRAWSTGRGEFERFTGFDETVDRLAAAYVARAYRELGILAAAERGGTIEAWQSSCGVLPRYAKLLSQLWQMLIEDGWVTPRANGWHEKQRGDARSMAQWLAEAKARYPLAERDLEMLDRCGRALAEVLRGHVSPLEVLFPAGSAEAVQALYAESPFNRLFNDVAGAVAAELARQTASGKLRILEVGAGTGATTAAVLEALGSNVQRYVFSDIAPALVRRAEQRWGERKELEFRVVDVERDLTQQELGRDEFDVVVAANVLHATRDVEETLRRLRQVLRERGLLVLVETTRTKRYAKLTFGLTDGWWRFDDRWRAASPLLDAPTWQLLLSETGFATSAVLPSDLPEWEPVGQQVIVALAGPTPQDAQNWATRSERAEPARRNLDNTSQVNKPRTAVNVDRERVEELVRHVFADVLRWDVTRLTGDRTFQELGIDSLLAIEAIKRLKERLGIKRLAPPALFEYPTVAELTQHLVEQHHESLVELLTSGAEAPTTADATTPRPVVPATDTIAPSLPTSNIDRVAHNTTEQSTSSQHSTTSLENVAPKIDTLSPARHEKQRGSDRFDSIRAESMAVIGLACRWPGAEDAESFWLNLQAGVDSIGPVPAGRGVHLPGGGRVEGGFLSDVEGFDAEYFRISPLEARQMEPRQRLFLETAYTAVEQAGYGGARLYGTRTGVFVGVGAQVWMSAPTDEEIDEYWATGFTPSVLASRVSYYLNLQGPCLTVDTACSSSLVALHLAMQSLRRGECDLAVVGGVHLNLRPLNFAAFQRMGALASDLRSKAFDERADGFVPAEGVGVVVLKPLRRALNDGDAIRGVVRGSAMNNDGKSNGLTAPNPAAQRDVICEAWHDADIDPTTLSYVEAHGTGTALGDPIEVQGLTSAFRRHTMRRQFCRLGSVKSNVGHAEPAAGMASFIKVRLALEHEALPASLHVVAPNRHIEFEDSPLVLNDRLVP